MPARALNGMRTISRIGSYNKKNFLIALFNKGLIDLRVSLHRGLPAEECNGQVRKVFLKSKNRTALVDEGFQARKTFHIHGYLDHFRAVHLGVSAHVLVLPIFQSTAFSSHDVAILISKDRSFTRTRL